MSKEVAKTNAMRLLDAAHIPYRSHGYEAEDGRIDGKSVADKLGIAYERIFKTLVTTSGPGLFYVFIIPVDQELDLKKAAKAAGVKHIEMCPAKDLLKNTGYVHGGCSPLGMKKPYPTFLEEQALLQEEIVFSAGKIGAQIACAPDDLLALVAGEYADLCK